MGEGRRGLGPWLIFGIEESIRVTSYADLRFDMCFFSRTEILDIFSLASRRANGDTSLTLICRVIA